MSTRTALDLTLYVITDRGLAHGRSHLEVAKAAIAGGATVIQLRDKQAEARDLYRAGLDIQAACRSRGVLFIMNDRLDLALAVDADGVHMGQEDLPTPVARRLLGQGKLLGVSAENGAQAAQAERDGADYVAIGPIYEARGSKGDAGPPVGPQAIAEVRRHTRLPVVAIGGIKAHHVPEVLNAGASGIAVISAVVGAPDITAAARDFQQRIQEARG
jgi:thiamine-phosphate pyrophosphorylase